MCNQIKKCQWTNTIPHILSLGQYEGTTHNICSAPLLGNESLLLLP